MINEELQIKELHEFRHFHDKGGAKGFDYENELLSKMMSNVMFKNEFTRNFLNKLQKRYVWMLESTLVIRNFFNYTNSKYYNKHVN